MSMINHKLAQYVELYTKCLLPELSAIDVDVEYNKYKNDPKKMCGSIPIRPDILVHNRQSGNIENYLAIEAKKHYSTEHDKKKIKYLVDNQEYNYLLGCLVSYQPSKNYFIVQFLQQGSSVWERLKFRKQPFELINNLITTSSTRTPQTARVR